MSYQATVISIMIASPSDVSAERNAAAEVIYRWNAIYSSNKNQVLLPVRWETHSASDLSGRAQQQINDGVLRFCDLLVGIFWTRLGTPTGEEESGTVEEIKEHMKAGRPVMVFFSRQPVAPESIDPVEYSRLSTFKMWCREHGITSDYDDPVDFSTVFNHQLQLQLTKNPYLLGLAGSSPNQVAPLEVDVSVKQSAKLQISKEAIELLSNAAKGHGQILVVDTISGKVFQAGGHQLRNSDQRTVAAYEFAMEELEKNEFVKAQGTKRQVFQVTKQGYDYMDTLGL